MAVEEGVGDYTQDGTVDLKGNPVRRSKRGGWTACSFIVGNIIISLTLSVFHLFLYISLFKGIQSSLKDLVTHNQVTNPLRAHMYTKRDTRTRALLLFFSAVREALPIHIHAFFFFFFFFFFFLFYGLKNQD